MKFINYRLSNDYIRGLVDGEGCFTFYPHKTKKAGGIFLNEKIPAFVIAMHARDRWLILETAEFLGVNSNIYIYKPYVKDGAKRGHSVKFIVRSAIELKEIIVPFFYKKLAGHKGKQFFEWLEKIGNDPEVPVRYKTIYDLYKSGFWDNEKNIPEKLR